MIQAYGQSGHKLMVVQDFPTVDEIVQEKVFLGWNTSYWEHIFIQAGGKFEECYKTVFVKEKCFRPPTARNRYVLKYIDEKKPNNNYREILLNEIRTTKPNVILSLGEAPTQFLTGESGYKKLRGSILNVKKAISQEVDRFGIKVIPTITGDDIRKEYFYRTIAAIDVKRALKYKRSDAPFIEDIHTWVCRSSSRLTEYFQRASQEYQTCVSCDIETYYKFITAIGFSHNGKEGVSIPLLEPGRNFLELSVMYVMIRDFLNSGIPIIGQNFRQFDWKRIDEIGWDVKNFLGDTILNAALIYPELPKNLGFLNSIYTEIPYFKDEGKIANPADIAEDKFYHYNAKDCVATHRVFLEQEKEIDELNLREFKEKGPKKWFHIYKKIEDRGIRTDETKIEQLNKKYSAIALASQAQLNTLLGFEVNVNSPKQVGDMLYNVLQLPIQSNRQGNLKTDEETIQYLILNAAESEEVKSILNNILVMRKIKRFLKKLKMHIHPDGRLRTVYQEYGTDSGRTSTGYWPQQVVVEVDGRLKFESVGFALQTMDKHGYVLPDGTVIGDDLRDIFIPSPNHIFIGGDYSGAEAIIVGVLAKAPDLIKMVQDGIVHEWTASLIYDTPINQISKPQREKGKRVRHAYHYDMKPPRLSDMILVSINIARLLLHKLHEKDPNIHQIFHHDIRQVMKKERCLVTPFGRRRDFFNRIDQETFKVGYSFIPQATVSDLLKFLLVKLDKCNLNFHPLGEFHDGFFGEIKPVYLSNFIKVCKYHAEQPIDFNSGSLPREIKTHINMDFEIGKENWGHMEKLNVEEFIC